MLPLIRYFIASQPIQAPRETTATITPTSISTAQKTSRCISERDLPAATLIPVTGAAPLRPPTYRRSTLRANF